jgi:hypothetical protein
MIRVSTTNPDRYDDGEGCVRREEFNDGDQ